LDNTRVYSGATGFLSPDPYDVSDPTDTRAYNRYSYVLNNPLSLTDPTGFTALHADGQNTSRSRGGAFRLLRANQRAT